MVHGTSTITIYKSAGNCSGKCEKIMTKLGNLIFILKFMIQSYWHNFCHVATVIYRIILKNIFANLLKISRQARSFTINFPHIPKDYDPLSSRCS